MKLITNFGDKYLNGFIKYRWFSPITKEIIYKRSYIKKLNINNDLNIGNNYIYIGSGSTIENYISNIDYISIGIYILNFKNKNLNQFFLFFSIILCSTAILLSGNRMPMILFLLGCFVILFFIKNLDS